MNFLPVVDRELHQAARRRSTYRLRWWVALIAAVVSLGSIVAGFVVGSARGGGNAAFGVFTAYVFGLCLLAGVFLTADCVSAEKRDGTLGLLFLTSLRPRDVVLGKLAASSLNALYGLLALLPMAGLPLLVGGVTGGDFWHTCLALIQALFFSLCAGLLVSCLCRDGQRAMGLTLVLLALMCVGVPVLFSNSYLNRWPPGLLRELAGISPWSAFAYSTEPLYSPHKRAFWEGLLLCHGASWLMLAAASLVLPRMWGDPVAESAASGRWVKAWRKWGTPSLAKRARLRARHLDANPVIWLASRDQSVRRGLWLLVTGWGGVGFLCAGLVWAGLTQWQAVVPCGVVIIFLMKLLLAVESTRFFTQIRREGVLEMLLGTPLRSRDLVKGQVKAFERTVWAPLLTFLGVSFLPLAIRWIAAGLMKQSMNYDGVEMGLFWVGGVGTVSLFLDSVAMRWFGMWLSLKMKNPGYAAALTFLIISVAPWGCCSLVCFLGPAVILVTSLIGYFDCQQDLRLILPRGTPGSAR